jgi:riboflavin kinase/FMN adenylyltransferase
MVLYPESHGLKLIQTQAEKIEKLERMGLQNVIVHPFTLEFSRLTATEFVRDFLVNQLKVKVLTQDMTISLGKIERVLSIFFAMYVIYMDLK